MTKHELTPEPSAASAPASWTDSTPNGLLGLAKMLHPKGVNLVCLNSATKRPSGPWRKYQGRRQTGDELLGQRWRSATGIAAICGPGDLRAIDIDGCDDQGVVLRLAELLGLPPDYPWLVRSGSHRGFHLWFRCRQSLPEGWLAKGNTGCRTALPRVPGGFHHLEVRYDRCLTILPPSIHRSGARYELLGLSPVSLPAKIEIEDLVEAIDSLAVANAREPSVSTPPAAEDDRGRARRLVQEVAAQVISGQIAGRNEGGFRLSCQLRDQGLSLEEVLELGHDFLASVAETGDHPYPFDEFERSAGSAFDQAPRHARATRLQKNELSGQPEESHEARALPEVAYSALPAALRRILESVEAPFRDTYLASALGVLSGALPNVEIPYRHEYLSPHLFIIILAPAGSGKGMVSASARLVERIDEKLASESMDAQKQHDIKVAESGSRRSDDQGRPPDRQLLVGTDTSRAALIDALADNPHGQIICATELDSLSSANNKDFGGFSDILRMAFQHERISESRRGQQKARSVVSRPRLAMVAAGTPDQYLRLVDNVSDGLSSRLAIYAYAGSVEWISPKPSRAHRQRRSLEEEFAARVLALWEALRSRKAILEIHLSDRAWERLDATFEPILEDFYRGDAPPRSLAAHIFRAGIIAVRLMAVYQLIRASDPQDLVDLSSLTVDDDTVEAGLALASTLLVHMIRNAALHLPRLAGSAAEEAVGRAIPGLTRMEVRILACLPETPFRVPDLRPTTWEASPAVASRATVYRCVERLVQIGKVHAVDEGLFSRIDIRGAECETR